jgi:hypothetical protein
MKGDNLPASLRTIPKTMNISNEKALIVNSLHFCHSLIADNFLAQPYEGIHWNINVG